MDAERYAKVRRLFLEADDITPDRRFAYVNERCGEDRELAREVLSLLAEHDADSAKAEGDRKIEIPPSLGAREDTGPQDASSESPVAGTRVADDDSQATQVGAQRTHASPRDWQSASDAGDDASLPPPKTILWARHSRRARRRNSYWLLLAAILPTTLVGWATYRKVDQLLRQAIRRDMAGLAESLSRSMDRFLQNQVELVESWSRQKQICDAVTELARIGRQDEPKQALRAAPEGDVVMAQLRYLSGQDDIKFVVWDRTGNTLASWLPDRADVGNPIVQDQSNGLARVFRGESILYGPERLIDNTEGFVPETDRPVMAPIVPVRNARGKIVAAMLVRGFGMFDSFSEVVNNSSAASGVDVYAISRDAVMLTDSPEALRSARRGRLGREPADIAAMLRVVEPELTMTPENAGSVERQILNRTYAAARVSRGQDGDSLNPYRNYVGDSVVGAWRWLERWRLGLIVEERTETAFAAARVVRLGFFSLAGLLAITATVAAGRIARRSVRDQALLHPLSRYEILGELGSGGMGVVYLAKHRQLGRMAALKVLRGDRRHPDDQLRFDREARLAATLSSPHCVRIYDYGSSPDGEAFCVMEYLKGLTLYEVVARSGHQSFGRSLFILRQICDAIGEAHAKDLLHRDLKPQNVMLSRDPAVGDWAVVFDFGLAKPVNVNQDLFDTAETIWSGTPMYMAPERFREPERTDPRSDIYALGCIAYFLISGHPPYAECDPQSMFALILNEQPIRMQTHRGEPVPEELVRLVHRCMAKSLEQRFQSIDEVAQQIDRLRVFHTWTSEDAEVWWQIHGESDVTA